MRKTRLRISALLAAAAFAFGVGAVAVHADHHVATGHAVAADVGPESAGSVS